MTTNLLRGRHSVTCLNVHLVFVTKYRKHLFTSESLAVIESSLIEVARKMGFEVLEFNGETDHVHLLISYPPKHSIPHSAGCLRQKIILLRRGTKERQNQILFMRELNRRLNPIDKNKMNRLKTLKNPP
jgi:REP element-mobilizing transposase RayT